MSLEAPRFEVGRELLIAGINETYTFESREDIPRQWERFSAQMSSIPGRVGDETYGVCWNYKPGVGFDYLSGVEVQKDHAPADLAQVRLPAQRYAVFSHEQHVSWIPKTIQAIWSDWLPGSEYEVAESPSFERYTADFDGITGRGGIEIWIPLQ